MKGSLKSGDNLGSYTLIKSLGCGGMAEVFLARHSGIGGFQRLLALKVIHPTHSENEDFIRGLVEEAKIAVQLSHPNVGQVFDLGLVDNTYFIVMEFIDGKDLHRLLFESSQQGKIIPVSTALYVAECVAMGLAHCHTKKDHYGRPMNLIHRDVSPQNVFLSWNGEVKLLDFGIAKVNNRLRHTEAGVIKGKLQYMSPEQITGSEVDGRSDLFSCGICLYEMLAGEMAYQDLDALGLLERIRSATLTPIEKLRPNLDPSIVATLHRALAVDPADRFLDGDAFGNQLRTIRQRLYPEFRPSELGRYLTSIFDETPFYLEEPLVEGARHEVEDFDLSGSVSSSIIFRADVQTDSQGSVAATELPSDEPSFDVSGSETALLDVIQQTGSSIIGSTSGGDSMTEDTQLFSVPSPERANPFTDPSTNEGFVVPKGATPEQLPDEINLDVQVEHSAEALKTLDTEQKETIEQSERQHPKSDQSANDNPFDASTTSGENQVSSSVRKPFGWAEKKTKRAARGGQAFPKSGRLLTLGILVALATYLVVFALPHLGSQDDHSHIVVTLESEPSGARIFIDGKASPQTTNTSIEVPRSGTVTVTIMRSGFRPAEFQLTPEVELSTKDSSQSILKKVVLTPLD